MATNTEILRYFEINAHIKKDNYIEILPIVDRFNGCYRNEVTCKMEDFSIWCEGTYEKNIFRQKVKKELPKLEEKFTVIKEKYYRDEDIREQLEFSNQYRLIKHTCKNNYIDFDSYLPSSWDFKKNKNI